MPRLMVFQHVAAEPLGTLHQRIRARGLRIRFHNFHRHPEAQPDVDRYHGLVVLGGPQNVMDQHRHPHLGTELRAIESALRAGKPVLGVCLGAQLLAHVLGAPVRRHVRHEIGWYALQATEAGRADAVLGRLGATATVFQWHGCTYDLPSGAMQLARTTTCEQQAFRYGESAYGFQFHLEADAALIERWLQIPAYRRELEQAGAGQEAQQIRAASAAHLDAMRPLAAATFDRFLDLLSAQTRRATLRSTHGCGSP
ncbi:MAG: gamma-glutamyl-gamma-aminobutyrate hydrolase family protein [Steroidobacteraceae bacterium]